MEHAEMTPKQIILLHREALNLACAKNLTKKRRFQRGFYGSMKHRFGLNKDAAKRMCKLYKKIGDVHEDCIEDENNFKKKKYVKNGEKGRKNKYHSDVVLQHFYNVVGQDFSNHYIVPTAAELHFELVHKYGFVLSVSTIRSHLKKYIHAKVRKIEFTLGYRAYVPRLDFVPLPQPVFPFHPCECTIGDGTKCFVLLWKGIQPPTAFVDPSYRAKRRRLEHITSFSPKHSPYYVNIFVNKAGRTCFYVYWPYLVKLSKPPPAEPAMDPNFLANLFREEEAVLEEPEHDCELDELFAWLEEKGTAPAVNRKKPASKFVFAAEPVPLRRKGSIYAPTVYYDRHGNEIEVDSDGYRSDEGDEGDEEVDDKEAEDIHHQDGWDGARITSGDEEEEHGSDSDSESAGDEFDDFICESEDQSWARPKKRCRTIVCSDDEN